MGGSELEIIDLLLDFCFKFISKASVTFSTLYDHPHALVCMENGLQLMGLVNSTLSKNSTLTALTVRAMPDLHQLSTSKSRDWSE